MAVKSLGIGVIGTGDVALKLYLPVISEIDPSRAWLAAVADVDEGRARRAQSKFGGRHVFTDYRDLLGCPDVDVVVNLTGHKMHAEINLATLDAGKHLYTEKPMATTLEEADRIVEKAAAAGDRPRRRPRNRARSAGGLHQAALCRGPSRPHVFCESSWVARGGDPSRSLLRLGLVPHALGRRRPSFRHGGLCLTHDHWRPRAS